MRVAIVGLGPSHLSYVRLVEGLGDWRKKYDEVWCVNGFSSVLQCTRGFAMDDVRIQEIRARGGNKKIANMLEAYKRHPGPIYTSRAHPDYPALVDYPYEAVINSFPYAREYFNSTIAYPIALAIHERAESIDVYGADYTFADKHVAEKGRACCEYWLGIATEKGIKVGIPDGCSMLDSDTKEEVYGYDTLNLIREYTPEGWCKITFEEKPESEWPSAEMIEQRYDKTGKHNGNSQHL